MRGLGIAITRVFSGEPLPADDDIEGLVVMGGPMGVSDGERFPWIAEEKRLIERALRAEKPVLGVCLGAQLIADVLGARVYRNRFREIGWFRVEATEQGRHHHHFPLRGEFVPFHWHGDTFDLPAGAVHLARSAACEQQAFAWGHGVLGLQFHLEVDAEGVAAMSAHCGADAGSGPYVQSAAEMLSTPGRFAEAHAFLDELLDSWKEERHDDQT